MVSVPAELGGCHAANAGGHGAEQDGVAEREQGADLEGVAAGVGDDQDAKEADHQDNGTLPANRLFQEDRRGQRGEQRRGEVDGRGAGQRHQAEGDQQQALRGRLRNGSYQVRRRPAGAEHDQPVHRDDECSAGDQATEGAEEKHLTDRIEVDQPFRRRAGEREQHRRCHHVPDGKRNAFLAALRDARFHAGSISRRGEGVRALRVRTPSTPHYGEAAALSNIDAISAARPKPDGIEQIRLPAAAPYFNAADPGRNRRFLQATHAEGAGSSQVRNLHVAVQGDTKRWRPR